MRRTLIRFYVLAVIAIGVMFLSSCEKEKIFPYRYENTVEELYSYMDELYFWIDSIADVNPNNYSNPADLLEAMRYEPRDKWSYITTKEENDQYYEEGTYEGYGFGYAPDSDGNIRITYLYESSDLSTLGIERGWKIKSINNITLNENSDLGELLASNTNLFEFESPLGDIVNQTLTKKLITINTVVYKDVITNGDRKIGYFVFESFIGPSEQELNDLFADFRSENINELVIDLRYNGGGMISIVEQLAGLIVPANLNNQKFLSYIHNPYLNDWNEDLYFKVSANTLGLNRIYFIAGKGSASASEAIINGLDTYMDVYIVGDDTYGKPVGMYSIESRISNLVYVPIAFKLVNSQGQGDYFNGLPADNYVEDDILHNFGLEEATFASVVNHITSGSFLSKKMKQDIYRAPVREIRTLEQIRGSI